MKITEEYLKANGYTKKEINDAGVTNPYFYEKEVLYDGKDIDIRIGVERPYLSIFVRMPQVCMALEGVDEVEAIDAAIKLAAFSKVNL